MRQTEQGRKGWYCLWLGGGFALFAAAALVVSCWVPVFDPALSSAMLVASRMDHVSDIGPIEVEERIAREARFIPAMMPKPNSGFLVMREPNSMMFGFVMKKPSESNYSTVAGTSVTIRDDIPFFAYSFVSPAPPPSVVRLGVLKFASPDIRLCTLEFNVETFSFTTNDGSILSPGSLIAAGYRAEGTGSKVQAYVLFFTGDPNCYTALADETGIGTPTTTTLTAIPTSVAHGFLVKSGSKFFYSFKKSGGASLWTANDFIPAVTSSLGSIPAPLVGATHSGRLLAQDDKVLAVLDDKGNEDFVATTGALRFVHELYDAGNADWYLYFVLASARFDGGRAMVTYKIYRIKTGDLDRLK